VVSFVQRIRLPSLGFVVLVASHVSLVAFLAWGYAQPPLDRVWEIMQRMHRRDFTGLTPEEVATIQKQLDRHPGLTTEFVGRSGADPVEPTRGGWLSLRQFHLLIVPQASGSVTVGAASRAQASAYPIRVHLQGPAVDEQLVLERDGRQELTLPAKPPSPALIRVTVDPSGPPQPGVRRFELRLEADVPTDVEEDEEASDTEDSE
jgi:hypothetical protein